MHEEKELLVQLIKKYPVIENKQTDATNIKKKQMRGLVFATTIMLTMSIQK